MHKDMIFDFGIVGKWTVEKAVRRVRKDPCLSFVGIEYLKCTYNYIFNIDAHTHVKNKINIALILCLSLIAYT